MTGCVVVSTIFEIGSCFRLDLESGVLLHDGKPTSLGPRAIALLRALVGRAGQYVSKSDLLDAGWPHDQVNEGNVAVQVLAIRRTLTQGGGDAWIETLPRRGYRFLGPVKKLTSHTSPSEGRGSSLPPTQTSFVGRERELVEIKRLLPSRRLLTIVGPGGIGKTRLALQVANEVVDAYRDGVWMADLVPLRESSLVPATVSQLLGVAERPGKSSTEALCAYLKSRQVLLILDNCEHLVDACARLVDAILRNTKDITIIATSREPLRLSDEQSYVLQPLSLPEPKFRDTIPNSEAVQLLVERVRQQLPHFELTPERAPVIAEICLHLDGIPLALELAAARTRSLSVEQINARLADRFRLLTNGSRAVLPRHQTLRAALDWSYDLLAEDERVVLRRLSIFPGTFTVEAATAVASDGRIDEHAVIDLVSQIVSRSLVIADTAAARTRYRLLETVRAYALEKLEESGESDGCLQHHARFFRDMFERGSDDWQMPDPEWRATYLPELANVRAAFDWALGPSGENDIAIDLAGVSGSLWTALGLFGEGVQRLEAAMARIKPDTSDRAQARLLLWLGRLLDETPARARTLLERALDLYKKLGDPVGVGLSLVRLGRVLALMGEFGPSEAALTEARPLLEAAGSTALNHYYFNLGFLKNMAGDPATARMHYERALELAREQRSELSVLATLGNLANVKWGLGDLEGAAESLRELVALIQSSAAGTRRLLGFALMNLAELLIQIRDLDASLALAREGLPLVKEDGSAWIFSDYGSLRAGGKGTLPKAALLAGYADHAHASNGGTRSFVTARARDALRALLREKLPAEELDRLFAEGAKMSEDEACRLALED